MMVRSILAAAMVLAMVAVQAQAPNPPTTQALTIYSSADPGQFDPQELLDAAGEPRELARQLPGVGVVREVRKMDLTAGMNSVELTDVAGGIDPTSVSLRPVGDVEAAAVLEQSFQFDAASPDRLLRKYVGKRILINRKPLAGDGCAQLPESKEGKLLSYDAQTLVIQTNNRQMPIEMVNRGPDIMEVKLFNQPALMLQPTLSWKIDAKKAGQQDMELSYETDGLTWRADYRLVVNDKHTAGDLSAWASIVNMSGASYADARLKLVAGGLRRERMAVVGSASSNTLTERSFAEYHLYTLDRPISVADHSTRQIELFAPRPNVSLTKRYVYGATGVTTYGREPRSEPEPEPGTPPAKVEVALELQNDQKSGLGLPLPGGRVRVYKRDEADGVAELIGENVIGHTAKDEMVSIGIGSAMDLVGEQKQTDFKVDMAGKAITERTITESFQITLRNHRKEAATVSVRQSLYRWRQWQITACSEKYTKRDATSIEIPIEVLPNAEKVVTYSVKYTW